MSKKLITYAVIAVVIYFVWRKFGDSIKSAITSVAS